MFRAVCLLGAIVHGIRITRAEDCPAGRDPVLTHETQLRQDILCDYQSSFRPVKHHTNTVEVKVRFSLKYISFDSLEETLTVHSWVALTWQDEFLPWNPTDYGGLTEIILESHEIWTPSMSLFNADITTYSSDTFYSTCLIENTGKVMCVPHLSHSAICRTNLKRWPYDSQNCSLFFGSWMHTGEQINFTFYATNPVVMDEYQAGPGWKLKKVRNARLSGKYICCPNSSYPMLKYTFELEREAAGPAAIIVVPAIVLVLLTLSGMVLDVRDNVRLTLECFSLFGHFIFINQISYELPKHSADTPIILLFLKDSIIMTLVSILVTLFLMSLRRRVLPPPTWIVAINRLVSSGPGRYVVFTEFDPSDGKVLTDEDKRQTDLATEGASRATADWTQFSNLFNSICFIVYSLIYFVIILTYIPFGE